MKRSLHYYDFGPFRVNVTERLLQRDGEIVSLTPKVFDTLLVLVENNGHVVEKNELMQQLWPDSFVEESSLTQNVSLLRRALSEGAPDVNYIETIPKRGYRFVAEVREHNEVIDNTNISLANDQSLTHAVSDAATIHSTASGFVPRSTNASGHFAVILGCVVIGILIAGALWFRHRNLGEGYVARSVAVLPFKTIGTQNENDLLGLGMADALIIKLSRLDQLTVLPTSSVFRYTNRDKDAVAIGRDLGVESVLDGTVQRDGDWVRVTAQLIRLQDGKTLWSGTFDERYSSIFNLQDSISDQLAYSLRPQVATKSNKKSHLTDNTQAYQAYLTGLYFWNRRTRENLPKAIEQLEKAVSLDPEFGAAHAILGDCYYLSSGDEYLLYTRDESLNRATKSVSAALELDDSIAEAHMVKAGIKMMDRQFEEAAREFQRTLELNPNLSVAHVRYAYYLYSDLKIEQALYHMRRAQQLDPVSSIANGALAGMLYNSRDFDGCIEFSKRALELEPKAFGARLNLGEAYARRGMFPEAHAAFDVVRDQNPGYVYWEKAQAYALAGKREDAHRSVELAEKHVPPERRSHLDYAMLYAALGEKDKAFAEMEQMNMARFVVAAVKYDPGFDPIRNDPRYSEFMARKGIR
jgi:DNA-binding winged helix-turn-helix (wHTH) protein/TolB-like protein/Flp pilus assembly protein TadD